VDSDDKNALPYKDLLRLLEDLDAEITNAAEEKESPKKPLKTEIMRLQEDPTLKKIGYLEADIEKNKKLINEQNKALLEAQKESGREITDLSSRLDVRQDYLARVEGGLVEIEKQIEELDKPKKEDKTVEKPGTGG